MLRVPDPVTDLSGRRIGSVRLVHLGRNKHAFWEARSLDGCDLGTHPNRIGAEEAIQDDWEAGRPRDPDHTHERFRPIYGRNTKPVFLGNT